MQERNKAPKKNTTKEFVHYLWEVPANLYFALRSGSNRQANDTERRSRLERQPNNAASLHRLKFMTPRYFH